MEKSLPSSEPVQASKSRDFGVETRSIDYVPPEDRHGKVAAQGPFWFLGNFQFFSIAIGFVGPSMGLDFISTAIAGTLGILFGTLFMAFHASQGPDLGLPQMIQSRAQFGYRGVIVPLIGTLFTFVAFNVVDSILVSQGLKDLYGWNTSVVCVALTILAVWIAIYGHDWLHIVFRVIFWISLPLFVVLTIAIITGHVPTHPASTPFGFSWVAFAAQFAVSASYNITYAPYVSDYTRYLPAGTSRSPLIWSVFIGASASAIWLIILGAWLAVNLNAQDGLVATHDAGEAIFPIFGTLLTFASISALTATMGLNAYSGKLSLLTIADSISKIRPTKSVRIIGIFVLAFTWLGISLSLDSNAVTALFAALTMMLYVLVPWTAVNLTDYFVVRHGHYSIKDIFRPDGLYGVWNWKGLTAYFIGFAASAPFFVITGFFQGPAADWLGGVDVSWLVGLVISSAVYYALASDKERALPGEQQTV